MRVVIKMSINHGSRNHGEWGLVRQIGPWKPTARDKVGATGSTGGDGHRTIRPGKVVGNKPPPKLSTWAQRSVVSTRPYDVDLRQPRPGLKYDAVPGILKGIHQTLQGLGSRGRGVEQGTQTTGQGGGPVGGDGGGGGGGGAGNDGGEGDPNSQTPGTEDELPPGLEGASTSSASDLSSVGGNWWDTAATTARQWFYGEDSGRVSSSVVDTPSPLSSVNLRGSGSSSGPSPSSLSTISHMRELEEMGVSRAEVEAMLGSSSTSTRSSVNSRGSGSGPPSTLSSVNNTLSPSLGPGSRGSILGSQVSAPSPDIARPHAPGINHPDDYDVFMQDEADDLWRQAGRGLIDIEQIMGLFRMSRGDVEARIALQAVNDGPPLPLYERAGYESPAPTFNSRRSSQRSIVPNSPAPAYGPVDYMEYRNNATSSSPSSHHSPYYTSDGDDRMAGSSGSSVPPRQGGNPFGLRIDTNDSVIRPQRSSRNRAPRYTSGSTPSTRSTSSYNPSS